MTHASSFANRIGEGAMLNLSQDGLACRISRELSDSLDIGGPIGVVFELGSAPTRIEAKGTIKNKTAAGSAHSIIVGVCFNDDAESEGTKDQLARLLGS
ncbi:MAG: PilZ domain-containing protein [Planctomycetes bacterium]|nr:PilZ domain-containing protein [Planctomycetota bacterium]